MDYFDLYKQVLIVIREERPRDGQSLIKEMNQKNVILEALNEGVGSDLLVQFTFETLENLIEENLIKGKIMRTKEGTLYTIEHLTTAGHQYLQYTKDPTTKEKIKSVLREEGIPMTPQALTKVIARLVL